MEFTPEKFARHHRRLVGLSRSDFTRTGHLNAMLHVWHPAEEDPLSFVAADPDLPERDRERLIDSGMVPVPGNLRENEAALAAMVAQVDGYAAATVSEAWVVSGPDGHETMRMGISPSEHPMRREIVFIASLWPEAGEQHFTVDEIIRERNGRGVRLERDFDLGWPENVDETLTFAGWLANILPDSPAARNGLSVPADE